ncbi:MAG TPA: YceI family protein [Gemmataceae bacterium]|nr:YceI family protein [Gemmataceae bacterium]
MQKLAGVLTVTILMALLGCSQSSTPGSSGTGPSKSAQSSGAATAPPAGGPGAITPENTKIEWVGTKKDGKHDGGFKSFTGGITPAKADLTSCELSLDIDINSLFADNPKLTSHLKSPDFFGVKQYPKAKFLSTKIEAMPSEPESYIINGKLTLHGTTKEISIPAKVTKKDNVLTLESQFTFDRLEYGISYKPDQVDKMVTVKVSANIPLL